MCMADMYSREGGEYAVAHCNFHLRGADADADAEMVEKWADEHGVPFFRADFDTAAYASQHGISIEMAARELRYGWFARIAFENGYDAVAVAHNANDNAETLVLNLLRGTGLRGLCGMSRSGDLREGIKLLRPMLGMSRKEIEAYAAEHGVEYREDSTNAELEYKRNRIRNAVFPEFERINPSFVRTLNTDMEHFAQADAIVQDYFIQAKEKILEEDTIKVPELLSLKHWRYVLFRLVEPLGFHADTFDALARRLEERSGGERSETGITLISEVIPKMISTFKMLLPTTFPMVMSALPFNAATMLTAASGRDVPMATMVRPTTSSGIPSFSAILEAPSTNQSAPFIKSTKPTTSNKICIAISMILTYSPFPFSIHQPRIAAAIQMTIKMPAITSLNIFRHPLIAPLASMHDHPVCLVQDHRD